MTSQKTERASFAFEAPEGIVYVTILPGKLYAEWEGHDIGHVETEIPAVRVDTDDNGVKLRGRSYVFSRPYAWQRDRWCLDTRNYGYTGFRMLGVGGNPVSYKSPTFDKLAALEEAALAAFAEAHPNWQTDSRRLCLEKEITSAEEQLARVRSEAEKTLAGFRSRLAAL